MNKTLSVVLAVLNEEANLAGCLKSVESISDEIIIVDGGSKDKTLDIAKKFGARIIKTNNPPIFHINKNKAIDAAKCGWVLQLDADERVSIGLVKEIKEIISTGSEFSGYWIPRKNFFLDRFLTKGGQYPDYTLRLYKNGLGRLPAKDVHEQAIVNGNVGYLKNDLLHLRDLNFAKYMDGLNRYTDILALQMQENNLKPSLSCLIEYFLLRPAFWFLKTYIRHKGFVDGFAGFVFALFSSLRFSISYIKYVIDYKRK